MPLKYHQFHNFTTSVHGGKRKPYYTWENLFNITFLKTRIMNSFSTDYTPRTKSDGIITPLVGRGENIPIYKEPKIPISMEGEGVADLLKKGLKKGSRSAKTQIVKAARKAKGRVTARVRAVANKKLAVLKRKIQSQLKQKVTQAIKKCAGIKTIPKKIIQAINKKVGSIIRNPPKNIKSKIRKNTSVEIKKTIPKKNCIKGGLTHKQLDKWNVLFILVQISKKAVPKMSKRKQKRPKQERGTVRRTGKR